MRSNESQCLSQTSPAPAAVGESASIRDYVQRTILNDPEFVSLRRRCGRSQNEILVSPRFRPACFTRERVDAFGRALENFVICDPERRLMVLDHLWRWGPDMSWPLILKMAQLKNPILDDADTEDLEQPDSSCTVELQPMIQASLRRDVLVSRMVEAIVNREFRVTGFLAGDAQRQSVEILPEWWLDHAMVCSWKTGELLPLDEAPPGTPFYRGLQLVSRPSNATAIYETGVGGRPTSRHLFVPKLAERATTHQMEPSLAREAAWLHAWLLCEHPGAPPATVKTIEEAIRADYRRLKLKPS